MCACSNLFAWGPEGHSLVARIAEAQLTPAARERVANILGPGQTLASISSWADEVRRSRPETAPWHYIDIPIDQKHLNMTRDCPKGDCVIAEIERLEATLRDPSTPAPAQREALMFLVHFIGDMHQPLHCSDNHDHGGNEVQVVFNGRTARLHGVWDGMLLSRIGAADQLFPELSAESARHKKYRKGSVERWAEESHKAAQKVVYGKLPAASDGKPVELTAAYEAAADPLIKLQLEKAGARLAAVLNTLQ